MEQSAAAEKLIIVELFNCNTSKSRSDFFFCTTDYCPCGNIFRDFSAWFSIIFMLCYFQNVWHGSTPLHISTVCLQVYTYKQNALTRQKVQPMHHSSIRGVEDMATLEDLHDGAIMHNLFLRYQQRHIYVSFLKAATHLMTLIGRSCHSLSDHCTLKSFVTRKEDWISVGFSVFL